jgi:uncharacterized HAD superfamily protein
MLLAIDLDGVVCDIGPEVAARVERRFGVACHPATWRSYDLGHLGLPPSALRPFLDQVFADPALYQLAPPVPGVLSALGALGRAGWHLVGLTARSPHLADVTRWWLRRHRLVVDDVLHAPFLGKAEVAAALGVTAAIEDNADEAERLGQVCDAWLLDRPYNADHQPVHCRRVHSWEDAIGRLCQLPLFA